MKKTTVIILLIILGVVLLIGIWSFTCYRHFADSINNMQIVIEDLRTGETEPVRTEGVSIRPQFSADGRYLYFMNRPPEQSKNSRQRLLKYSIRDRKIIQSIIPKNENISMTGSVLHDRKILCYTKNADHENICLYSIGDGKITLLTDDANKKSEASVSPDGRWISYIEENAETSRSNVCIIPSGGGRKRIISSSNGMLSDVKNHAWSPDSKSLCYIDFISLMIKSTDGEIIEKIDLAGLTNFKGLLPDPANPDRIYVIARESDGGLSFLIFAASIKNKNYKPWKENRSFWEMNYSISPDGGKLAYTNAAK